MAKNFLKSLVALAGTAWVFVPHTAYACEKCFGAASNASTVQAISLSMLTLLCMVGVVWGGIIMFFSNMDKRAKMLAASDLIVTENGELLASSTLSPPAKDSQIKNA